MQKNSSKSTSKFVYMHFCYFSMSQIEISGRKGSSNRAALSSVEILYVIGIVIPELVETGIHGILAYKNLV